MSLTNTQKAEMALARTSHSIPTGSNPEREMMIARAALQMAAAMMERVMHDGLVWAGEFSVVEYFMTAVRNVVEAQEKKEQLYADRFWLQQAHGILWDNFRVEYVYADGRPASNKGIQEILAGKGDAKEKKRREEERRYLAETYGFQWDALRQCYTDGTIGQPPAYIQRLLEKRKQKEEQPMAEAGPRPDSILLPTALATGEYIHVKVKDQFGREMPIMESELDLHPSQSLRYPERHLNVAITVSTYSDDPVTRAAEQALVKWLKTLKHNDPRRTYIEQSLRNPTCGIFLLYSHMMAEHVAVGVQETGVDNMPIRVLGMHYDSDAHYSVMDALEIVMGESVSVYWITEKK